MGKQNRITLKNYFQTGKVPAQGNYTDLIDSFINLEDSDTQIIQGGISSSGLEIGAHLGGHITASGNISASGYITASELLGNINANYIQMPFNKDVIIGSGGIPYNISASGNFRLEGSASFGGDITASNSIISASGLSVATGSFGVIKGFSPIMIQDVTVFKSSSTFTHITASGDITVGGTVFGTVSSGTGAQTGITSLGTQTKLDVVGPTDLSGSIVMKPVDSLGAEDNVKITGSLGVSATIDATDYLIAGKNAIDYQAANSKIILGQNSQELLLRGGNVILGADNSQDTHTYGDSVITGSLTLGGTTITATATEINKLDGLTTSKTELNYLDGITNTNATVVKTLNQHLTTTASPTFAGLSITISNTYTGTYATDEVRDITTAGLSFNLEIRSLEAMRGKFDGVSGWSGRQYMRVVNANVKEPATVLITPVGDHSVISANPIRIQNGGFYLTFENDGLGLFEGGTQNYVVRVIP